jgi:hypothetical protein
VCFALTPSGKIDPTLRLITFFTLLTTFLLNPVLFPFYSLIPENFNTYCSQLILNSYDIRGLEIVNFGAEMDFSIQVSQMSRDSFQTVSGNAALCVLDTIVENLVLGNFLGPFPPHMESWNGTPFTYHPLFTIEKTDSTPSNPKFRFIFNGSAKRPKTDFQKAVAAGIFKGDPHEEYYIKLAEIESFNDNLTKESCNLASVKDMIFNFLGLQWF